MKQTYSNIRGVLNKVTNAVR